MKAGVLCVAAMSLALGMGIRPDDTIQREGAGQRRAALDKMELKAASNIWADLSDWTNGDAVTAESTKGKVVVIATWASFYKTSHAALTELQKLSDRYGKEVVVVGVHNEKGWDAAKSTAEALKIKYPYAHDASGKVRSALQVDQDPDFYVIDRAGNMRYADIVTGSVDAAVSALVAESAAEAASVPTRLAEAAAKAQRDAAKTKTIAGDVKPGQVIDVNFPLPDPSFYKDAAWHEKNSGQLAANDVQGSALPKPLGNETWLTKQLNTNGRVIVLDFWATWCGPCKRAMPRLDEMYKENKADLVIIGISDENRATVENFLKDHKHAYGMTVDENRTLANALQIQGIPHVVVLSTDGIVRWQGNPLDPTFAKVVKKTIDVDPGVAARRKAEIDYIKSKGG
jgi:cytochrome c biogenesis protein CcmG/thiol:disulfide interchange protein DsbE